MPVIKLEKLDPKDMLLSAKFIDELTRYQPSSFVQRMYEEGIENQKVAGATVRVRVPENYTVTDGPEPKVCSRPGLRVLTPDETSRLAAQLMSEARDLRQRIAALEVENAKLHIQIAAFTANALIEEMPFVEGAPQSEVDRIWDAVRAAAQS